MKTLFRVLISMALLAQFGTCSSGSGTKSVAVDAGGDGVGGDTSWIAKDGGDTGVSSDVRLAGGTFDSGDATGGDGSVVTALDPTVTVPSHDCHADTSANCISIAGVYNGLPIDVFCNQTGDLGIIVHAGKWVIGCNHLNPGFARLYVPIQQPGSVGETAWYWLPPHIGEQPGMGFEFSVDTTTSVALFSGNLERADLADTIALAGAPYRIVSGTFHGVWATPGSPCYGLLGSACAAADINVTFRIKTNFGSCFGDEDCTPPKTCDSVARRCSEVW
jgi:hypothetical protein